MYILFYSMRNLKSKFLASLGAWWNLSWRRSAIKKMNYLAPSMLYYFSHLYYSRTNISISEPSRTLWCISFFIHAAELEVSARLKIQLSSADPMCKSCKKRMKNGTFHLQTIYQCKQTPKYSKWFSTN